MGAPPHEAAKKLGVQKAEPQRFLRSSALQSLIDIVFSW